MLTEVTTVTTMDWRTRLRILADAAVAAVQACRKPRRCASCDDLTWPTNPPNERSPR